MNLDLHHLRALTRREFLTRASRFSLGSIALGSLIGKGVAATHAEALVNPLTPKAPPLPGRAKAVIYLSMSGAPPQQGGQQQPAPPPPPIIAFELPPLDPAADDLAAELGAPSLPPEMGGTTSASSPAPPPQQRRRRRRRRRGHGPRPSAPSPSAS